MKVGRALPIVVAAVALVGGVAAVSVAGSGASGQESAADEPAGPPDWVADNPCSAFLEQLREGTVPLDAIAEAGLPEQVKVGTTRGIGPRVDCLSETPDGEPGVITDVVFFDETNSVAWVVVGAETQRGYDWDAHLADYDLQHVEPFEHGFVATATRNISELSGRASSTSVDLWTAYEPKADIGN